MICFGGKFVGGDDMIRTVGDIEEMNSSELIEKLAKETRTWEIRKILEECKDLEEAKKRVDELIEDSKK